MYSYKNLFQRNIGIFTPEEQEQISNLKVAIAGSGALGGGVAYILAKLGVGEIRLADHDVFSVHNISSQYGAGADTIGNKKVDVVATDISRINPYLNVVTIPEALDATNIEEFLDGADFVVDAIDFFEPEAEAVLHRQAQKNKQWIFSAQNASTMFSVTTYNPNGASFEDLFFVNGKFDMLRAIQGLFPVMPESASPELVQELIQKVLAGEHIELSSISTTPFMGAGLLVEEMIKVIKTGRTTLEMPDLFLFDVPSLKLLFFLNGEIKTSNDSVS